MDNLDIVRRRLYNQRLAGDPFEKPEDVVSWLVAVQAQDYPGATWSLALRSEGLTSAMIDQAFADGKILRTHVMRPTWHFVAPVDIRWLLELTAPRVKTTMASYFRKFELDDAILAQTNAAMAKALMGGNQLTRSELESMLQRSDIIGDNENRERISFIMMRAELDGVICSGGRRGKQFTYALLEERAPQARTLEREEALAELTRRYFISRSPATVYDFSWWSGLTVGDARAGLEMIGSQLESEEIDGTVYWYSPDLRGKQDMPVKPPPAMTHLLPTFDEYFLAYKDRSATLDPAFTGRQLEYMDLIARDNGQTIVIDGRVAGTWRRTLRRNAVHVSLNPFKPLVETQTRAVNTATERFGAFL